MAILFTPDPVGPDVPRIPELPRLPKRVPWRDDWPEINKLWWKHAQRVDILIYMDGASFDGGPFYGLQHAINAVESDPWPWAKFVVTTANRYTDPQADQDNVTLTDLDLDAFDEVWLFGISSNSNLLSAGEVAALESFMDVRKGGVFSTGDHDNMGRGLSGSVKRIKDLRAYPAPPAAAPTWNTTVRDGNGDGSFTFGEQSDATPQQIRPRYRYHWSGLGISSLKKSPHALLCSEHGILRTLPDHQHEGQVTIPASFPVADWPKSGSHQELPEVVAWGRIIDPAATNTGDEFPVIGAYDGHRVDVGRIVADSTWHHWFDINMVGFDPTSNAYRDITSYFQNVAAWLAPKNKQAGMRNGVFWLALHTNVAIEHQLIKVPLPYRITIARDALGQLAPQCQVSAWIWDLLPVRLHRAVNRLDLPPDLAVPVEDAVLAQTLAILQERLKLTDARLRPPDDLEMVPDVVAEAAKVAVAEIERDGAERLAQAAKASGLLGSDDVRANGQRAEGAGTSAAAAKPAGTKRTARPRAAATKRKPAAARTRSASSTRSDG